MLLQKLNFLILYDVELSQLTYEVILTNHELTECDMSDKLIAKQSISINAPASRVWDALTNPEMIKKYLFGTDAVSDWKVGSPITYKGVWEGKTYEDKGKVLAVVPERLLESTYWSSMSGISDIPENYKKVRYELKPASGSITLIITQDNNATEEEKNHSEQNWKMVLQSLKGLLENQ
jgi:uncharacterized protein YndB with AHSA1/START domain